jgi:DNA-binding NtrC family response regulator
MMKPLSDCSVLIVEDDFVTGLELMRALSDEGCRGVKVVRTIEGALEELSGEAPDVVTLDLDMRGQVSTPVAEALQARQIPFVIVSGHAGRALPERHGSLGVCEKPFAARDVISLLTGGATRRKAA